MLIIPAEQVLAAYRSGYFPMAESAAPGAPIFWYTAKLRGVIPMDGFRISRRTMRYIRRFGYQPAFNTGFEAVVDGCADRPDTWISPEIKNTFMHLHELGHAHSVEVIREGKLVGGLYGLAIGAGFFAESVFQLEPEAHKAAMYFCHKRLLERGFVLWDAQFHTEHLGTFGCKAVPQKKYMAMLRNAVAIGARFD